MADAPRFYDPWVGLYDRMVDWDKRLGREGPALLAVLQSAARLDSPKPGAVKVLDVACGTGRHLGYLAGAGLRPVGADVSAAMAAEARRAVGAGVPVFQWSMAEAVPADLDGHGPFDAVICLGNSFPHLVDDGEVVAGLRNFRGLLRPGGLLLLGLKALAVLRDAGRAYLPLVKRQTADGRLIFVRFYDFGPGESADFHLVIIGPGHPVLKATGGVYHAVTRLRVWRPGELVDTVSAAGFDGVRACRDLAGEPWQPGDGEDLFVFGRRGE